VTVPQNPPQQRVAVVTGGTGGLGVALLKRLVARDYLLGVTYLLPEEAAAAEDDFQLDDGRLMLRRVDATDPEAVNDFMKEVATTFGGIHVVCSLVGGWAGGRDVETTDDLRFERMIDLNLRSAFYTVRAAVPYLRESGWGRIVLVGSRAAMDTPPGQAAFNIAKAGVVALSNSLAQELMGTDITANVVLPSVIDTPATRASVPYSDYVNWPTPDEIAAVIDFIVSEESGVMSGATIPVHGKS
jgi:NAD(P)-dependent dehydrogenase (short-subunit alcohol dehydrogenase family)